jgi:putative glutamine amidotransferase
MKPIIGLTAWRSESSSGSLQHTISESYIQALAEAGAAPVLIPLALSEEALDRIIQHLDGILFTGGGDVAPDRYGRGQDANHPKLGSVDVDRDRIELHLFLQAVRQKKPFFGICRGIQLINVALGGTLYIDITDELPGAVKHAFYAGYPRDYLGHTVQVTPGSRLERILGGNLIEVNSLHHQGVEVLAPSLQATAFAPDGLVEGVELNGYPFGVAVQWHPECMQQYAPMRALFSSFVEACTA